MKTSYKTVWTLHSYLLKEKLKKRKRKEITCEWLCVCEENESKIQSESEETVRESFQPIPQELKEDKLNEELKTVFFIRCPPIF